MIANGDLRASTSSIHYECSMLVTYLSTYLSMVCAGVRLGLGAMARTRIRIGPRHGLLKSPNSRMCGFLRFGITATGLLAITAFSISVTAGAFYDWLTFLTLDDKEHAEVSL